MSRTIPWMRAAAWMALVVAAGLLVACGSAPQRAAAPEPAGQAPAGGAGKVLGRGDWFLIYQPGAADTLRSMAARFLGSEDRWWAIADFNDVEAAEAGRPLVVPLKSPNPIGVYADEYQTVPILAYHRFGSGGGKMVVSPSSFAAQLEWLANNDYRVIPVGQLAAYLAGKQALPKRAVAITIDDGYESVYRYALPLLRRYGFPATLFVYTDFVGAGDALSWQQLQELASSGLIDIQAHSKTHRNLIERAPAEADLQYRQGLELEVRAPREILERRLPVQVRQYAFPYGDANDILLDILARQHYQLAVTVNPGGNAFFAQPLMLHRTMVFGDQGLEAFKAKLQTSHPAGGPGPRHLKVSLPAIPQDDGAAAAVPLPAPASAFEEALQARALGQARQARWAEAAQSWEIAAALRPDVQAYRDRLGEVRRLIAAAVPERLRRAEQAARRGELDAATADFLAVLALQPDHEPAAEALRRIERERNKIQYLGKFSRVTLARRGAGAAPGRAAKGGTPGDPNELEHASILAVQGEVDDAIALLEQRLSRHGGDARTCQMLADLYARKGKRMPADASNTRVVARMQPAGKAPPRASSPCP